jgi:hypothetical protein
MQLMDKLYHVPILRKVVGYFNIPIYFSDIASTNRTYSTPVCSAVFYT